MRTFIALALVLVACGGSSTDSATVDAGETTTDALAVVTIDAPMTSPPDAPLAPTPDAPLESPDAAPGSPDAGEGSPDAAVGSPDAAVGSPDAAAALADAPEAASPDAAAPPQPDAAAGSPDAPEEPDAGSPLGVPGASPGVVAYARITSGAMVSWDTPSSTGTSAIVSYTITASPGGATVTVGAGQNIASVTGLTIGETYTFTVVATNDSGDGPPSAPSAGIVVQDGPAPPQLAACGGTGKITLVGDPVPGAVNYEIYVSTSPNVNKYTAGNPKQTSILPWTFDLDDGFVNGTRYYMVVIAMDANFVYSMDSAEIYATPRAGMQDVMVASSRDSKQITFTDCYSTVPDGESAVTRTLSGDVTKLGASYYGSVYLDTVGRRLFATTYGTVTGVLFWSDADTVDGNIAPKVIAGGNTGFSVPGAIFHDVSHQRLYVADSAGAVRIFDSPVVKFGNVKPYATITGNNTGLGFMGQIYVDVAADTLYAATYDASGFGWIGVWEGASTLTGDVNTAPDRKISFSTTSYNIGVWGDPARDLLYVSSPQTKGYVFVVEKASLADGKQNPLHTIGGDSLTEAGTLQVLDDVLYITTNDSSVVQEFTGANRRDGTEAPTRSVAVGTPLSLAFFVIPPKP